MGKGDKKTRKGKIINGTYGVRRPRKAKKMQPELTAGKKATATAKPKAKATAAKPPKPKATRAKAAKKE